ncbi:MAG TPA: hypothetical protein VJK54_10975 [Chthoniobacterales bacterium]|nr:hypothetical protein [Chthoniobacterales bacterium]
MNKTLSLLAIVLMATTSFAGQAVSSKKVVCTSDDCRFHANEWQVDVSTVGAVGVYGGQNKQALGANLGVNYFWSKYFGVGIDNSVGSERNAGMTGFNGLQAYDSLQADLIARYPICSWNLAPYAMVGGGASWGPASQGNGNVGGGLEYRLMKNVGFFTDCRWLYGNNGTMSLSMAMPRIGMRLGF